MKYFLIILIILNISCSNNNSKNKIITGSDTGIKFNVTKLEKDSIKRAIVMNYLKIPIQNIKSNTKINYNNYVEFKKLDSLFDIYSRFELTNMETQYFSIIKFKRHLITFNYDKALKELKNSKKHKDFDDYKTILLGILYDLKGESSKAKEYYSEVILKYTESDNYCENTNYYIVCLLLEKENLNECPIFKEMFKSDKPINKSNFIKSNFLTDIEL